MRSTSFLVLSFCMIMACSCKPGHDLDATNEIGSKTHNFSGTVNTEALVLSRYESLEELKNVIDIEYNTDQDTLDISSRNHKVILTCCKGQRSVTSVLKTGISQADLSKAKSGSVWNQVVMALKKPFIIFNKSNLLQVDNLARRRPWIFGKGDVAFYDLAESMVSNITEDDLAKMSARDLSEKGFLNTFNHITAQTFMTSLYSERLADFVADVHELYNMPQLVSGDFTQEQLADLENGPVDNYIDMVNNEWGQELGKELQKKYGITRNTLWTAELLTNYLNDIQAYQGWAFRIGFQPFKEDDDKVIQFANKINRVKKEF